MPDYCRKNKIVLSNYNYQRDIENRILMADFTVADVQVLQEILDGPLNTTIKQIASHIDISPKEILSILNKLSKTQLIEVKSEKIIVDKEMRKYYESQISKFDDNFEPDLAYIQGLLSKVSMHELVNWYPICRSSDNIFSAIVENYLSTPKAYETYLSELKFDDEALKGIMEDVFTAPDFKIHAETVMKKYSLSREQFEEAMLLLEYNFVCYLGYSCEGNIWTEVITPFHEWRTYLRFLRDTKPQPIKDVKGIERTHPEDFGFVMDIAHLLEMASEDDIVLEVDSTYVQKLMILMTELDLALIRANILQILPAGYAWLAKPLQEKALTIYQASANRLRKESHGAYSERDISEVERSMRRIARAGWIYVDDFLHGQITPIGSLPPVALKNKGKKWYYDIPSYAEEDLTFTEVILFEHLFEAGMVSVGMHEDRPCFCVTPFGRGFCGDHWLH